MLSIIIKSTCVVVGVGIAMLWGYAFGHYVGFQDGFAEAIETMKRKWRMI